MKLTQGLRAIVLSGLFAGALSCESKPLEADSAPASPKEFIAAFAESSCSAAQRCCEEHSVPFDADACYLAIVGRLGLAFAEYQGLQVDWDPAAALRCIQEYSSSFCGERELSNAEIGAHCDLMFQGRIGEGEPCMDSVECRAQVGESAYCDSGNTDVCQVFRAEAPSGLGETCLFEDDCVEGSYCNVDTLQCEARLPLGAGPCNSDQACIFPAVCDDQAQECINPRPNGERCSDATACQSNYCTEGGVCARPEFSADLCEGP